jgi:hypothetical protein
VFQTPVSLERRQIETVLNISNQTGSTIVAGLRRFAIQLLIKVGLVLREKARSEELMSVQYSCKFCILREATLTVTVKKTFLSPAFF